VEAFIPLAFAFSRRTPPKSTMLEHQTRLDDSAARPLQKGFRGFWVLWST